VRDQGPAVRVDQQVLGAPAHAGDAASLERLLQAAWHRPAQAALAHDDARDSPSFEGRRDTAARGLDFREFRHPGRSCASLGL